jgi:hypothetical protein
MRPTLRVVLGLGLALSAAGCSDYLSGPGVTTDPNNISSLTRPGPLYVAIQVALSPQREGQMARDAMEYMQQIAGVARQQLSTDRYLESPTGTDTYFGAIYGSTNVSTGGGGLLDIHKMEQLARKADDSLYVGIGKVYEALVMGFAADIWGDVPYRQAADSTILKPRFDPQLQVYADLQANLDSAVHVYLAATGQSNLGPPQDNAELIYAGRNAAGLRAVYTAVAHSLKARLYMHMAAVDPTAYQKALAEAAQGISTPDDDFLLYSDATASNNNIWWQFNSARAGDIGPGAAVVEIMKRRAAAGVEDAQRLNFYFTGADGASPAPVSDFFGYRPAATTNMVTSGTIYNGNGSPASAYSFFASAFDGATGPGDFRMPELSYAETQLILAEATWHVSCAACAPTTVVGAAQPFLDNARRNRHYGMTGGAPVIFGDAPGTLPATLQNIMEEKYVTLFLNPEVWNDWKRTCLPSLAPTPPAGSTKPGTSPIPGRLPYGLTEINANSNTPGTSSAGVPVTSVSRNPNQPAACPVLNYTSSNPLAN